jgi:hypothetical protein
MEPGSGDKFQLFECLHEMRDYKNGQGWSHLIPETSAVRSADATVLLTVTTPDSLPLKIGPSAPKSDSLDFPNRCFGSLGQKLKFMRHLEVCQGQREYA